MSKRTVASRPHGGRLYAVLLLVLLSVIAAPGRARPQALPRGAVPVQRPVVVHENGKAVLRVGGAEASPQPQRLIVKLRPGKAAAFLPSGARAFPHRPDLFLVPIAPGTPPAEAARRYAQRADVLYAEPDYPTFLANAPNDPRWSEQWNMVKIDAPTAWSAQTASPGVVVAVIDTGIDFTHPDLQGNLWTDPLDGSHGFTCLDGTVAPGGQDDHGHGTHVAGIIGAVGDNGTGIAGLNWSVQLLALKVFSATGHGSVSDAVACFDKLTELRQQGINIRVSNSSWVMAGYSQALRDAMAQAEAAGVLHVCAAGNSSGLSFKELDLEPLYPAAFEGRGILAVAATDAADDPQAVNSNSGFASVDVAAPGAGILSTVPSGSCALCDPTGYKALSGTSMATPHAAGVAASLFHLNPSLTPAEARDILLDPASVDPLPASDHPQLQSTTHARLDFAKSIANPLVAAPQLNGFPQISVPESLTRTEGAPISLSGSATDPDGDTVRWRWGSPDHPLLLGTMLDYAWRGPRYPSTSPGNPYVIERAPTLARTATVDFHAFVNDGRGGSAAGRTWVSVLASPAPGLPPTGTLTVTPANPQAGEAVQVSYSGTDPEGGALLWEATGAVFSCCRSIGQDFGVLFGPGVYRIHARSIDPELNFSPLSSVVLRVGGAAGEPPIADLAVGPASGTAPLTVSYDATGSTDPDDPDGGALRFFTECEAWTHPAVAVGPPTGSCTFDTPGPHSIRLVVRDADGYLDERIAYVMVTAALAPDTEVPTVTITSPASGATVYATKPVTAAAGDDLGVSRVEIYRDSGVLLGSFQRPPYSVDWNTAVIPPGAHTLYAKAYDQSGKIGTSASVPVTVLDSVPPVVSLTAPADGATVSYLSILSADASDIGGIAKVEFRYDSGTLIGAATAAPYAIAWDTTFVAAGAHTVFARAYDQSGKWTDTAAAAVMLIDTAPPAVALTQPQNGATIGASTPVSAWASDIGGVARIDFFLDTDTLLASTTDPNYVFTWTTANVAPGPHTLTAKAWDQAGNARTSQAVAVTVLDAVAPTVSITAPAFNATVSGTVAVTASASDAGGVAQVDFFLDTTTPVGTATAAPYSIAWDTAAVPPGFHQLLAKARDQAGNVGTSSSVRVYVSDSAPPTAAVTAPAAGSSLSGPVTVEASVSDNAGVSRVTFYYDGTFNIGTDETAPYSVVWDTTHLAPGSHTLTVKAMDSSNNTGTSPAVQVTVIDIKSPTVSISTPTAGATVSGAVTVGVFASDVGGVATVDFLLDGATLLGSDSTAPYQITWNSATAAPGSHTLSARATDAAGNVGTSAAVAVTVQDATPPVAAVTAPAAGSSVSGTVTVSASASDNAGVTRVEIYRDSGVLLGTATTAPYSVAWSTAGVNPGSHTLYAKAYDAANNAGTSPSISITLLDVTPPTVSLTAPAAGSSVSSTVTVSATASDNAFVTRVEFYRDGGILLGTDAQAAYSIVWDSTASPGPHTLYAKAYDAAGNAGTSASVGITVLDVTPPAVAVTAPPGGSSVSGTVTVNASASDAGGVAQVEFFIGNGSFGIDTTAPYSFAWDTAVMPAGSYTLTAKATDTAGNAATSAAVQVTVLDVLPPAVSITAPAAGSALSGFLTVSASATDGGGLVRVDFFLDGSTLLGTDTQAPYTITWDSHAAAPGPHNLTAKAYDNAGNSTTSAAVSVTVLDTDAPTASLTSPANGASVAGPVAVNASAGDNVGVTKVEIYREGGVLLGTDTAAPFGITWDTSAVAVGSHFLSAKAYDAAGNTATSATVAVTVLDSTPPTVSITSPANGAAVTRNATTTITISAADNVGITKVEIYVGTALTCTSTSSPYTCAWRVPKTAGVQYSLQAKAYDARGNIGTSAVVSVTAR